MRYCKMSWRALMASYMVTIAYISVTSLHLYCHQPVLSCSLVGRRVMKLKLPFWNNFEFEP